MPFDVIVEMVAGLSLASVSWWSSAGIILYTLVLMQYGLSSSL